MLSKLERAALRNARGQLLSREDLKHAMVSVVKRGDDYSLELAGSEPGV